MNLSIKKRGTQNRLNGLAVWTIALVGLAAMSTIVVLIGRDVLATEESIRPFDIETSIALKHAANVFSVSESEVVITPPVTVSLSESGTSLVRFKAFSGARSTSIDLEVGSQKIVDGSHLVKLDIDSRRAKRGKMSESLKNRLSTTPDNTLIPVSFWLKSISSDAPPLRQSITGSSRQMTTEEIDFVLKTAQTRRALETQAARTQISLLLRSYDSDASVSDISPIAHAKLNPATLRAIEISPEILEIDLADVEMQADLNNVRDTLDYFPEIHTTFGLDGTNRKIGQIESANADTRPAPHFSLDQLNVGGPVPNAHMTAVSGVLIAQNQPGNPDYTGLAPDAQLYVRGMPVSTDLNSTSQAAINWGAKAINFSFAMIPNPGDPFGVPTLHDRQLDDFVLGQYRTIVKSAGNRGTNNPACTGSDGWVTTPGLGYNTITVGGFDDNNTPSRVGDTMDPCSSWKDPVSTNGDREKPEVVAPGVNIMTTNVSGTYSSITGTSFSAPAVTGTAALMMEAAPNLEVWPEIVKAVLMATARFNINGAAVLSEYDGAGAIDTLSAVALVRNGTNGNYGANSVGCASFPYTQQINLTAGKSVRIAIVWDQNPSYISYNVQPNADLDLNVQRPNGSTLSSMISASFDNTYEIVAFTAPDTGTYTINVLNDRCDLSPQYLAFAWYQSP